MTSLLHHYHAQCLSGERLNDPEQARVLDVLTLLQRDLLCELSKRNNPLALFRKPRQLKGAYIWGGVGVGKTFMMDLFYQTLPINKKMRIHFHAFMRMIHQRLQALQGKKNPLEIIVREFSDQAIVLCVDELLVTDITDAMILAGVFSSLKAAGICLVVTSNMRPDDLYLRGLQRDSFLPAIAMLKNMTVIMHVTTTSDYRQKHLFEANKRISESDRLLEGLFLKNAIGSVSGDAIRIAGRQIRVIKRADNIIWLDFDVICQVPRNQADYLELAAQYQTIFISGIRPISADEKNTISLFVRMIDVFYDAGVRLQFSADVALDEVYTAGHLLFDFVRTRSRLLEMQSRGV